MLNTSHYDLIFLADESADYAEFTHVGYVYANYVFATDDNDAAKAVKFPWLHLPRNINLLIQTMFQLDLSFDVKDHVQINQRNCWVIDLTAFIPCVIAAKEAETIYAKWIQTSGRVDNFDEFCAFMGVADYIQRNQKQHLMLCVFEENPE